MEPRDHGRARALGQLLVDVVEHRQPGPERGALPQPGPLGDRELDPAGFGLGHGECRQELGAHLERVQEVVQPDDGVALGVTGHFGQPLEVPPHVGQGEG